jgi:hypothetical protein
METLLPEFAKFGLGGIIAFGALWLWQRDQKKFEKHLQDDADKEKGMREQAEKDRDRMIDVVVSSTTAINDLKHTIELDNAKKENRS